ncbi:MurR/RpiR family transcriptional regulator [Roseibium algicola]|uniref:MurR/RpiR family transcriptional regulator n=1 Tax=Roseibium algicola TaxID=2857014 RepID=A0ABM6I024_9HYPH|nr:MULTISPECIES: MurR/RpiR family transcriptional regulator [Stappiaceae]MCR9281978.1 MurR/RpiR family transcriptional regulator [Paracoccaceae bacterium]MEC9420568.1 MurR/RpiR family transcriptional regulator [Pseudomonadota bacterium]AMN55165.1 RpiR family transcriptional regulator [Labrenzia sp. CP4]AQQ03684.1 MurR/RpiR family transcriptional regulator [Roseibium aggregatum]MBN8183313.1 MurR/RpiR family transcriptional regulator [Roseibium aggregatum]
MQAKIRTPTGDNTNGHAAIDLISALRDHAGQFPAREQKVADYVQKHLSAISDMTIAELAKACGVSTPTVVRFCRTLGCDGFREFKLRLAQNLAVSLQYISAPSTTEQVASETAIDRVLGALYATANVMRQQVDPAVIERAVEKIAKCRQLLTAGIGGGSTMVAGEAASRFFRLGIPSVALHDSYLLQMRAATLGPDDVLLCVSASGEADELVSAAEIAGGYGATTIAIAPKGSRLAMISKIPILVDLPEDPDIFKPTASRYAHLVIVDAIAMTVAQVRAATTSENLRRIRSSLTAFHGRTGPQPLGD